MFNLSGKSILAWYVPRLSSGVVWWPFVFGVGIKGCCHKLLFTVTIVYRGVIPLLTLCVRLDAWDD